MNSLDEYFSELTRREGSPASNLAARWPRDEIVCVSRCIRNAFKRCNFEEHPLQLESRTSGPAMGNRLATHFADTLGRHLRTFSIRGCAGQGYPDRQLVRQNNGRACALELKATRGFEPKSTHRMILTCSSGKLQRHFVAPIRHLLLTVFYRKRGNKVWIQNFRLDFLEPSTKVNIRLEASVSHHLLANATHPSCWGLSKASIGAATPETVEMS